MKTSPKLNPTVPYQNVNKAGGDYNITPGGSGGGAPKGRRTTPVSKVGPVGKTTMKAKPTISKLSGKAGGSGKMAAGKNNLAMSPKPTTSKLSGKASGRDVNLGKSSNPSPTTARFPGGK